MDLTGSDAAQGHDLAVQRAENGNVALIGEIDLDAAAEGTFVLALGFGTNPAEAALRAISSLQEGFEKLKGKYTEEWQSWQKTCCTLPQQISSTDALYSMSMSVLKIHEAKRFPGGMIASLSVPWGFAKGDNDLGGYHLVWPRDVLEAAGALIAGGALGDGLLVLEYLRSTQEADGNWNQNMWMDGTPYKAASDRMRPRFRSCCWIWLTGRCYGGERGGRILAHGLQGSAVPGL